jgi:hypothetical protein
MLDRLSTDGDCNTLPAERSRLFDEAYITECRFHLRSFEFSDAIRCTVV